jgi:hypothetical protein
MEINPKVVIIIFIALFLFVISGVPFKIVKDTVSPQKINVTITPTPEIIYETIEVFVTPTIDGKTYFAGEYQSGIRKMGRYFAWLNYNVEGKNDMSGHVKVYDYRQFNSLHIFNPSDYNYYEVIPQGENKTFFLIFVKIYLDDVIGDNVYLWLPNEHHFYLQSNGTLYRPIDWEKQIRIKEIENTPTDDGATNIEYYGGINVYSKDKKYRQTAGETFREVYDVIGGESNAIDGYIIYEIDKGVNPEENIVIADLYSFGSPSWILKH